jgi:hypothetical protein
MAQSAHHEDVSRPGGAASPQRNPPGVTDGPSVQFFPGRRRPGRCWPDVQCRCVQQSGWQSASSRNVHQSRVRSALSGSARRAASSARTEWLSGGFGSSLGDGRIGMPWARRGVVVGNEAPAAGLASMAPDGSVVAMPSSVTTTSSVHSAAFLCSRLCAADDTFLTRIPLCAGGGVRVRAVSRGRPRCCWASHLPRCGRWGPGWAGGP